MWIRLKDQTQEYFLTFISVIQVRVILGAEQLATGCVLLS